MRAQPLWRWGFDLVEASAGKRIDDVIDGDAFAVAAGIGRRTAGDIADRVERASRQVLHALNLPAGSDVRRMHCQIASLEREVRDLRKVVVGAQLGKSPGDLATLNG